MRKRRVDQIIDQPHQAGCTDIDQGDEWRQTISHGCLSALIQETPRYTLSGVVVFKFC
jgi:hypothetical protein